MNNIHHVFAILGIACGGASLGCSPAASVPVSAAPTAIAVEVDVVRAEREHWPDVLRVQGRMLAHEEAVIGTKLAGRIAESAVDLGSMVARGALLAALGRSELDLRVELAEAQLRHACAAIGLSPDDDESQFDPRTAPGAMMEQALVTEAESNVERGKKLLASRAVTQGEFDALAAQLDAARARRQAAVHLVGEQVSMIGVRRKELALARQAVVDSRIVAPFDGVVSQRLVSPGEFVHAGQAIVALVRTDLLRFTAGVPESRAAAVRLGQQVVFIDAPGATGPLTATVSRISPTVTQSNRSLIIEADVQNAALAIQAGLFATAEIVVDAESQTIVVPASAVSRFAGVQKVWKVEQGAARQQTVRTGREDAKRVEILAGLAAGDAIIANANEGKEGPIVAREGKSHDLAGAAAVEPSPPSDAPPSAPALPGLSLRGVQP